MSGESEKKPEAVGRNEPCPCGSGKKYKRCCGVNAAPKLSAPATASAGSQNGGMPSGAPGGFDPAAMGLDQAKMMELAQAMQRLPRGQIQRLQSIMQKAMAGKDVSREAAEFEKTLPLEFQQMLRGMQPAMAAMGAAGQGSGPEAVTELPGTGEMTEEQAKELVAKAAAEGKIGKEEAQKLLGDEHAQPSGKGKTGKFWNPFARK